MVDYRMTALVGRLSHGELNRRDFVKRATAIGLSTTAMPAALAGGAAAAPARPLGRSSSAQIDASTLVVADNLSGSYWLSLDPAWFYEINPTAAMYLAYETLYDMPDSTRPEEIIPLLADGMPEFSEDGLTATIPIKQGVTFHTTGNEMTAADWIFSWNRLKNVGVQPSFLATDYWAEVTALDDYTLQITLPAPNAALAAVLVSTPLAVTDSRAIIEMGGTDAEPSAEEDSPEFQANEDARDIISGASVGTGPFIVRQFDVNSEVILERNPDYWGDTPQLERVIWRNTLEANAQLQAVQIGEADIAFSLNIDQAPAVEEDSNLQLLEAPSLALQYIGLNLREDWGGPLAVKEARQALAYAVDYDGILESILGGAAVRPATTVPLPLTGSTEVESLAYTLDLDRAQELWDGSGVGDAEIEFSYDSDSIGQGGVNLETLATKIKSDWEQIDGVTVNLKPMPGAERLAAYRAGEFQATLSPWTPDYPDVDTFATPFFRSETAAAARVGFSDPEIDALIDQGLSERDPERRTEIYVDIQTRMIDHCPYIVLYQPTDRKPASIRVQGAMVHSVYQLNLRNASKTE